MDNVRLDFPAVLHSSNLTLQPALEVDRHPTGHTHPPQTPPLSPTTERERLRDLVYDQIVRLNLRGLLWEDSATVAEILAPHTRRSPFIDGGWSTNRCAISLLTCT